MDSEVNRSIVAPVLVTLLVLTAGCSGLFGDAADVTNPAPTATNTGTDFATTTAQRDTERRSGTSTPTTTETTPTRDAEESARRTLLSLAEIDSRYNLTGERYLYRSNASETVAASLAEQQILFQFERTFQIGGVESRPRTIFTSISRYESSQAASAARSDLVAQIREGDGDVSTISVLGEFEATQLRFENSRGLTSTLIVSQSGPVTFYVVTADTERYYPEYTRTVFIEMARDTS
ncbi:hypothetical protein [Haloarcula marina]|uniref:hypothetical protein n=1 Tax=Haloarcula marina TaxID=2961574 RepID=UPI0020B68DE1|nr:hypothetical protein [Halomicroarcula marina]